MYMNSDEGLVLGPFHFSQILSGNFNQGIEHVEEKGVCGCHYLFVRLGRLQGHFRVPGPYHLDP